jgi:hypothetical protein
LNHLFLAHYLPGNGGWADGKWGRYKDKRVRCDWCAVQRYILAGIIFTFIVWVIALLFSVACYGTSAYSRAVLSLLNMFRIIKYFEDVKIAVVIRLQLLSLGPMCFLFRFCN